VYKIVPAGPGEIPVIRQLTFRVWPQTYAKLLSQEQIDYMLEMMYSAASLRRQMNEEGCQFIILYRDQDPRGFASYSEINPGIFKLHKLYVLSEEQGKGGGRFMLENILDTIRGKGAVSLQLQVNRGNDAQYFYEKLGFRVVRELDLDIGGGFFMNDYVMELGLSE